MKKNGERVRIVVFGASAGSDRARQTSRSLLLTCLLLTCFLLGCPARQPPLKIMTCGDAAARLRTINGWHKAAEREVRATCEADRWPTRVRECFTVASPGEELHDCRARLSRPQRAALDAIARTRSAPLPPICLEYRDLVFRTLECHAISADQSYELLERYRRNTYEVNDEPPEVVARRCAGGIFLIERISGPCQ
jgi:hypothetical protein